MLLLLAGTGEAMVLAKALSALNIPAIASLSGATRAPRQMTLETRIGGFGGAQGFRDFVKDAGITAVLDATHPFASAISSRTVKISTELGLPYCQLLRPEWVPQPDDNWTMIACEADAAKVIPKGATVFLATGRQTLLEFANLTDRQIICRQIDPPDSDFPFPNGEFLIGRPPFSVEDEVALFRKLKVDWLVVKNAGGNASRSKLDAARALNIPVAMIKRPKQPDAMKVENADQALDWVRSLI